MPTATTRIFSDAYKLDAQLRSECAKVFFGTTERTRIMRLEESEHFEMMQYVRSLSLLYGTIPLPIDSHHNSDRACPLQRDLTTQE